MTTERLFGDQAHLYDAIYASKDYGAEAERIHRLLSQKGVADGESVVEGACGTGRYLAEFVRWYRVYGFDKSESMLAIARKRAPQVSVWRADLTSFTLGRSAGAIVCLFSSIGYVRPVGELRKVARACFQALRPGGVVIVEPFVSPEQFDDGAAHMQSYERDGLKVVRAVVARAHGAVARLNFHWLVARRDAADVEHFVDYHELALYQRSELIDAFHSVGFAVEFNDEGRTMLLGTKPEHAL